MRIISQNGMPVMTDIPYEKVVISQSMIEPNKIVAWDFFGGEDNIILMAEYSTPEKAEKAMQKLHECYTGAILMQNVDFPEGEVEKLKSMAKGFICVNNRTDNVRIEPLHMVFRFPQEDEI